MRLYFAPFACSLAIRAALDEAGLAAEHILVHENKLPDGRSFRDVNALGYVPVLELDDGRRLTEGPAILQWIADERPQAGLAPPAGSAERTELQIWLNFISTELHKALFTPILDKSAPEGARTYAQSKLDTRFAHLEKHLTDRHFLLDAFSAADFYLLTILNWCEASGIDLPRWPKLAQYRDGLRRRPSIARAISAELPFLKVA